MQKDEAKRINAPDDEYVDIDEAEWLSDDFTLPEKKGDIFFFNGIAHEIALPFDFDEDQIAKSVDTIYTDFDFFGVESLKEIVATSKDHEEFRKLVANYFYEHLLNRMYELFGELTADAISQTLEELRTNKMINEGQEQYLKDKKKLAEEIRRMMRERSARGRGRQEGSGAFKDIKKFKVALEDSRNELIKIHGRKPYEQELIEALEKDSRFDKRKKKLTQRTFRNWLRLAGIKLEDVVDKPPKKSKRGK